MMIQPYWFQYIDKTTFGLFRGQKTRRKEDKEQNIKSKENETDKERKSEDIDDEEIERRCFTKTKILALKDNLTFKYTMPSC